MSLSCCLCAIADNLPAVLAMLSKVPLSLVVNYVQPQNVALSTGSQYPGFESLAVNFVLSGMPRGSDLALEETGY